MAAHGLNVDLKGCLEGDQAAWDAFAAASRPVMFAAIRRIISPNPRRDIPDIDDLIQDVMMRLLRNDAHLLRSFDPSRASLVTFLTLVARSTTIDRLRRKTMPTTDTQEFDLADEEEAPTPEIPSIPREILTARQQAVLHLLYDRDQTVSATSAILGITPQSVRSTRHKALIRLRAHFSALEGGDTPPHDDVQQEGTGI